jgi:annexin A7/11
MNNIPDDAGNLFHFLFEENSTEEKEKGLIDVIIRYSNSGRLALRKYYDEVYAEKNLLDDIINNLSSNFGDLVLYLFMSPIEYDCLELYNALNKITYHTDNIIEILTSRPKNYLNLLVPKYEEVYKQNLKQEIENKYKGIVGKRLTSLFDIEREENKNSVNLNECKEIALKLAKLTCKEWITDENIFNEIFAKKSPKELIIIGRYYFKENNITMPTAIEEFLEEDEKHLLRELIYNVCRPAELFCKKLKKAIQGLGTDTNTVNRICVTRNELDTTLIRKFYKYLYGVDLQDDVIGDTSGAYQLLLCELFSK